MDNQPQNILPQASAPVSGDWVQGDKAIQGDDIAGDKVMGDKIIVLWEGKRITLPARSELLDYIATIRKKDDFARWADLPEEDDDPLFEQNEQRNSIAPDTYIPTHARPLPTRVASFRLQTEQAAPAPEMVETLLAAARTVLLGEPGSGKTSALQRLTWLLAQPTPTAELPTSDDHATLTLPIFASLANFQKDETDLLPLLRRELSRFGKLAIADEASLDKLLRAKNVRPVLLLDGLNELNNELSEQGLRCVYNHLALHPNHAVHVTCRTADYDVATQTLPDAAIWVVQPLCDEIRYWDDKQGESDVRTYLRRHLGENRGKRLYEQLRNDERLRSLATLPLFLWMFKQTAGSNEGKLPVDRGGLLSKFFENELENKVHKSIRHLAAQSLQQLAWLWQQDGRLEGSEDELELILQQLPSLRRPPNAQIRQALQESGLLIDLGRGRLKLLHQLVQEYAAAAYLVRQADCAQQLPSLAQHEAWRECVILALWLRPALHTPAFLRSLMTTPTVDLRVRVEAARILAHVGDAGLTSPPAPLLNRNSPVQERGAIHSHYIEPVLIPIPAGNALLGSDDEDAYDNESPCLVPMAAFELAQHPVTNAEFRCFIEAGGYEDESLWTAGGQAWLRGEGKLDPETERELRQCHQRVCRDVEQWIADLRSENSLSDEDADIWRQIATWTEDQFVDLYANNLLGEKRRQPYYWEDSQFNLPNQPVVGVNWYEAMAYAAWLSRLTGKHYTLPSEAQWEWAARRGEDRQGDKETRRQGDFGLKTQDSGLVDRKYPWGDEWDAGKCNWSGSRLNQPSPIGIFPHGATADGLQDLAGNVYEWTTSLYRPYPYVADDGREDATVEGIRVMRGGSWYTDWRRVRCSYRYWYVTRYGYYYLGYRLARILS